MIARTVHLHQPAFARWSADEFTVAPPVVTGVAPRAALIGANQGQVGVNGRDHGVAPECL